MAVVLGVLLVPGAFGHGPAAGVPTLSATRLGASCPGGSLALLINGTLGVEGDLPPAPGIPNATVSLSYDYESIQSGYHNASSTTTCLPTTARTTVNATGGFELNLTLPGSTCGRTGCVSYAGPFGPARFGATGDSNAPYFLRAHLAGHEARLDWVAALNSVTTTPDEFGTYSVDAPVNVTAVGLDGSGNASVANVSYSWLLRGAGWGSKAPTDAGTLAVEDTESDSTGTATVWVNGSFNGTRIALPPVSMYLTGVPTVGTGQSLFPDALDVGTPAAITVNATGAYGYTYRASLSPGDGLAPVNTTCRSVDGPGGIATISCGFSVAYSAPGKPTPSASVTNEYSAATYLFPVVPVSATLSVLAGPSPDRAYVGDPLAVHVAVAGSTGTAPYGPACLVSGDGRFVCDASPGPNWTLSLAYPDVGDYNAIVTVADAAGTNRTVALPVEIAAPPEITGVSLNQTTVTRGGAVTGSARVTGGAFPLEYWWNVSDPASTLASGEVATDQIPSVSFVSGFLARSETVGLTIIDALGTKVSNTTVLTVDRPAVAVELRAPQENGTVAAGSPIDLSLVALDASGEVVDGFVSPANLTVGPACGPAWVNDSNGPIRESNGTYPLPTGAWSAVGLNVTVTPTRAGSCDVVATVPAFATGAGAVVSIEPDQFHLHLVRPNVVRASAADNATLYAIVDRFGNPDLHGFLIIQTRFGGVFSEVNSTIRLGSGGAALVWVNYSSPGPPGTLTVLAESGVAVLGPIDIPGLPTTNSWAWWVWLGLGVVVVAAFGVGWVRRRRPPPTALATQPSDPDEPLRRLAEGRAHVLARLREEPGADLEAIATGFPGPPPDPAELAEWVGTLVTEGLVEPRVGADGRPRFRLTMPELPAPAPRVEVDAAALDAALAQRDKDTADEPAPPP